MKIIHMPSSAMPEKLGGTEVYVDALATSQAAKGWQPIVLTFGQETVRKQFGAYERVVLAAQPAVLASELYGRVAKDVREFEQFLKVESPDAVHFHAFTTGSGISHARICVEHKIPYLITYHIASMSCLRGNLLYQGAEICDGVCSSKKYVECIGSVRSFILTMAGRDTARRFQIHDDAVKEFFSNASHTVATAGWVESLLISNGLRADKISLLRQNTPVGSGRFSLKLLPEKSLRIGYLSRISDDKGVIRFLNLASASQLARLPLTWQIAGYADGLKSKNARKLQSSIESGAVSYAGQLSRPDLANFLASIDVLVVPSIAPETGPLNLLEAWNKGVWVIGSAHSGILEFFQSMNLEFCGIREWTMSNFQSVLQKIREFQKTPAGAPERVFEVLTPESAAIKMTGIYESVLNKRII